MSRADSEISDSIILGVYTDSVLVVIYSVLKVNFMSTVAEEISKVKKIARTDNSWRSKWKNWEKR